MLLSQGRAVHCTSKSVKSYESPMESSIVVFLAWHFVCEQLSLHNVNRGWVVHVGVGTGVRGWGGV